MALTLGDVLGFAAQVKDAAGALANAGTMTLTITLPDGTAAAGSPFTITPTSTGLYDKDLQTTTATGAGRYVGYWLATGANAGAYTQVFDVRTSADPAIVSLADVKKHINDPAATTTHDDELERMIGAATGIVENDPDVGVGAVVRRTITGERQRHDGSSRAVWLNRSPVISVTTVTPIAAGGTTVTVADLDVDSSGEVRYADGYTRFPAGSYKWTYVVGRSEIPDEVAEAALIIVKHLWETQRGVSGNATTLGGGYAEEGATFVPGFGFSVPRRAVELLRPHKRAPAVA